MGDGQGGVGRADLAVVVHVAFEPGELAKAVEAGVGAVRNLGDDARDIRGRDAAVAVGVAQDVLGDAQVGRAGVIGDQNQAQAVDGGVGTRCWW